jgi:hypothetical protein
MTETQPAVFLRVDRIALRPGLDCIRQSQDLMTGLVTRAIFVFHPRWEKPRFERDARRSLMITMIQVLLGSYHASITKVSIVLQLLCRRTNMLMLNNLAHITNITQAMQSSLIIGIRPGVLIKTGLKTRKIRLLQRANLYQRESPQVVAMSCRHHRFRNLDYANVVRALLGTDMIIMTARKVLNENVTGLQTNSIIMTTQIMLLFTRNVKGSIRVADPQTFLPDTRKSFKNQLARRQVNSPPEMISGSHFQQGAIPLMSIGLREVPYVVFPLMSTRRSLGLVVVVVAGTIRNFTLPHVTPPGRTTGTRWILLIGELKADLVRIVAFNLHLEVFYDDCLCDSHLRHQKRGY